MARYVFKLPDVGEGIAEAELVEWRVTVGDVIEEDAPLADIMTDKANVEIASPVSGTVIERHGEAGQMVAIGAPLVVLEIEGEAAAPEPEAVEPNIPRSDKPARQQQAGEGALASPAVRKRAASLGLDLATVAGSGPQGRVLHEDLDARLGAQPPRMPVVEGDETIKVTGLRRRIAERMTEAARIPQFGYVEEIDVTALEALRARLNGQADGRPRLTLLPFLAAALTRVLPRFPQFNAHYDAAAGVVHRHTALHLGFATQTDKGLLVPVLRDAQALDLWDTATAIARLAAAARAGTALLEELGGSTLTVTSLGPLGGVATAPILNPPEVAILGPNRIAERVVVVDAAVVVRRMMNLSGAFDHRVIDGYEAAQFVQALKAALETPETLLDAEQPGLAAS